MPLTRSSARGRPALKRFQNDGDPVAVLGFHLEAQERLLMLLRLVRLDHPEFPGGSRC